MNRIEEETTQTLLRLPPPRKEESEFENREERDFSEMNFAHPNAQKDPAIKEENLIYHGSQENSSDNSSSTPSQPYRRETKKVGRNEPCPCGSGKKYKKCHALEDSSAKI